MTITQNAVQLNQVLGIRSLGLFPTDFIVCDHLWADLPEQLSSASKVESLYRVTVELARQDVTLYGRSRTLTSGMQVDADILQDERSLIDWALEPLYSLKGKS